MSFNLTAEIIFQANAASIKSVQSKLNSAFSKPIAQDVNVRFAQGTVGQLNQVAGQVASLTKNLKQLDSAGVDISNSMDKIAKSATNVNKAFVATSRGVVQITKAQNSLAKATQESNGFLEDFGENVLRTSSKFSVFIVAATAVSSIVSAFKSATSEAIQFDLQLNRLRQVSSDTKNTIADIALEVKNLSTNLGVSSSELIESAVVLKQAGIAINDVKKAMDGIAKASLAPNFKDIKQITEGSIAVFQQFGKDVDKLKSQLGSMNAVAGDFAVEASDLISLVQKAGGTASQTATSFEELLALFTSIRSTTRESADSIATGMRTIFTRLQRNETVDSLKSLGINLRYTAQEARALGDVNLTDQFVGGYKAVERLSLGLSKIRTTDPRFGSIIEELGGYRQVSRVIPLIQQFGEAQKALNSARAGAASIENAVAIRQESIANRLAKVREEFQALINTISQSKPFQDLITLGTTLATVFLNVSKVLVPLIPLIAAISIGKGSVAAGSFVGGIAKRTLVPKFATGGIVPGLGDQDSVPMDLPKGSYVIRKSSAQQFGYRNLNALVQPGEFIFGPESTARIGRKTLDNLNKTGKLKKFATGGFNPSDKVKVKDIVEMAGAFLNSLESSSQESVTNPFAGVKVSIFNRTNDMAKPGLDGLNEDQYSQGLTRILENFSRDAEATFEEISKAFASGVNNEKNDTRKFYKVNKQAQADSEGTAIDIGEGVAVRSRGTKRKFDVSDIFRGAFSDQESSVDENMIKQYMELPKDKLLKAAKIAATQLVSTDIGGGFNVTEKELEGIKKAKNEDILVKKVRTIMFRDSQKKRNKEFADIDEFDLDPERDADILAAFNNNKTPGKQRRALQAIVTSEISNPNKEYAEVISSIDTRRSDRDTLVNSILKARRMYLTKVAEDVPEIIQSTTIQQPTVLSREDRINRIRNKQGNIKLPRDEQQAQSFGAEILSPQQQLLQLGPHRPKIPLELAPRTVPLKLVRPNYLQKFDNPLTSTNPYEGYSGNIEYKTKNRPDYSYFYGNPLFPSRKLMDDESLYREFTNRIRAQTNDRTYSLMSDGELSIPREPDQLSDFLWSPVITRPKPGDTLESQGAKAREVRNKRLEKQIPPFLQEGAGPNAQRDATKYLVNSRLLGMYNEFNLNNEIPYVFSGNRGKSWKTDTSNLGQYDFLNVFAHPQLQHLQAIPDELDWYVSALATENIISNAATYGMSPTQYFTRQAQRPELFEYSDITNDNNRRDRANQESARIQQNLRYQQSQRLYEGFTSSRQDKEIPILQRPSDKYNFRRDAYGESQFINLLASGGGINAKRPPKIINPISLPVLSQADLTMSDYDAALAEDAISRNQSDAAIAGQTQMMFANRAFQNAKSYTGNIDSNPLIPKQSRRDFEKGSRQKNNLVGHGGGKGPPKPPVAPPPFDDDPEDDLSKKRWRNNRKTQINNTFDDYDAALAELDKIKSDESRRAFEKRRDKELKRAAKAEADFAKIENTSDTYDFGDDNPPPVGEPLFSKLSRKRKQKKRINYGKKSGAPIGESQTTFYDFNKPDVNADIIAEEDSANIAANMGRQFVLSRQFAPDEPPIDNYGLQIGAPRQPVYTVVGGTSEVIASANTFGPSIPIAKDTTGIEVVSPESARTRPIISQYSPAFDMMNDTLRNYDLSKITTFNTNDVKKYRKAVHSNWKNVQNTKAVQEQTNNMMNARREIAEINKINDAMEEGKTIGFETLGITSEGKSIVNWAEAMASKKSIEIEESLANTSQQPALKPKANQPNYTTVSASDYIAKMTAQAIAKKGGNIKPETAQKIEAQQRAKVEKQLAKQIFEQLKNDNPDANVRELRDASVGQASSLISQGGNIAFRNGDIIGSEANELERSEKKAVRQQQIIDIESSQWKSKGLSRSQLIDKMSNEEIQKRGGHAALSDDDVIKIMKEQEAKLSQSQYKVMSATAYRDDLVNKEIEKRGGRENLSQSTINEIKNNQTEVAQKQISQSIARQLQLLKPKASQDELFKMASEKANMLLSASPKEQEFLPGVVTQGGRLVGEEESLRKLINDPKGPRDPNDPNRPNRFKRFRQKISNWFEDPNRSQIGIATAAGAATLLGSQITPNAEDYDKAAKTGDTGSLYTRAAIGGSLSYAGMGAGFGLAFGPMGAAVGAVAGGLVGLVKSIEDTAKAIDDAKLANNINKFAEQIQKTTGKLGLLSVNSNETIKNITEIQSGIDKKVASDNSSISRSIANTGGFLSLNPLIFGLQQFISSEEEYKKQDSITRAEETKKAFSGQIGQITNSLNRRIEELVKDNPNQSAQQTIGIFKEDPLTANLLQIVADVRDVPFAAVLREFTETVISTQKQIEVQNIISAGKLSELKTGASIGRISVASDNALAGVDTNRTAFLAQLFSGGSFSSLRGIEGGFSQITGQNKDVFTRSLGLVNRAIGGNNDFAKTGEALARVSNILPSVLQQLVRNPDATENLNVLSRDLIKQGLGINGEPTGQLESVINSIVGGIIQLEQDSVKEGGFTRFVGNDINRFSEQLLGPLLGPFKEAGEKIGKALDKAALDFVSGLAEGRRQFEEIGAGRDNLSNIRLSRRRAAADFGEQNGGLLAVDALSIAELQNPFNQRQSRLTGGLAVNDVAGITKQLQSITEEAEKVRNQRDNAVSDPTKFRELSLRFENLTGQANNFQQALKNLTDTTARASAIQDKLNAANSNRDSRISYAEKYLTADGEEQMRMKRGQEILAAIDQNQVRFENLTLDERRLAVSTGRELGDIRLASGRTGSQVIKNAIGGVPGVLDKDQEKEREGLQAQLIQVFKTAEEAQMALTGFQQSIHDKFIKDLYAAHEQFFVRLAQNIKTENISGLFGQRASLLSEQADQSRQVTQANLLRNLGINKQSELNALRGQAGNVRSFFDYGRSIQELQASAGQQNLNRISGKSIDDLINKDKIFADNQTFFSDRKSREDLAIQSLTSNLPTKVPRALRFEEGLIERRRAIEAIANDTGSFAGLNQEQRAKATESINNKLGINVDKALSEAGPGANKNEIYKKVITDLIAKESASARGSAISELTNKRSKVAGDLSSAGFNTDALLGLDRKNQDLLVDTLSKGFQDNAKSLDNLQKRLESTQKSIESLDGTLKSSIQNTAKGFAGGGSIFKKMGTDTVPAMLTPGEFVVNKASATANANLLRKINSAKGPVYLANGGDILDIINRRARNQAKNEINTIWENIDPLTKNQRLELLKKGGNRDALIQDTIRKRGQLRSEDKANMKVLMAFLAKDAGAMGYGQAIARSGLDMPGESAQLDAAATSVAARRSAMQRNFDMRFGAQTYFAQAMLQSGTFDSARRQRMRYINSIMGIDERKIRKFANGGPVTGNGFGDTVPAMLTPGEFVLNRQATANIGVGTLSAANKAASVGINQSESYGLLDSAMKMFNESTQIFNGGVDKLAAVIEKFPTNITMTSNVTAEVIINGAEAFQDMQESFKNMMVQYVTDAIENEFNNRLPDAPKRG